MSTKSPANEGDGKTPTGNVWFRKASERGGATSSANPSSSPPSGAISLLEIQKQEIAEGKRKVLEEEQRLRLAFLQQEREQLKRLKGRGRASAGNQNRDPKAATKQPKSATHTDGSHNRRKHTTSNKGEQTKEKEKEKELSMEEMLVKQNKLLEKHREEMKKNTSALLALDEILSSSDDSDMEDEDEFGDQVTDKFKKFTDSTFATYNKLSGSQDGHDQLLGQTVEKIKDVSLHTMCMICYRKIGRKTGVWQCGLRDSGCYRLFHLLCIQQWARTESFASTNVLVQPDPSEKRSRSTWPCPNCRKDHSASETPMDYYCFCGKTKNPEDDLWITPHSCGSACGKSLARCDHRCTLLCHPGACPPCPQTVQDAPCYCGQSEETRRCHSSQWSCGETCEGMLPCQQHSCPLVCHAGPCPPCTKQSMVKCQCGAKERLQPCSELFFQCGKVCGKPYSCGNHKCEKVCHTGSCGPCPLTGSRKCACGKKTFQLPCDQKIPSCGDTCEKMLLCGEHRCNERCHTGDCPPCRLMVNKRCRCGSKSKLMPCHQTFTCEMKCRNTRNCERHQCRQKCCTGQCPPCQEICQNKLTCGNHKCNTQCHAGRCLPCPLTVDVSCACHNTIIRLPCGAEKFTPPPRCRKACVIPPTCHHAHREKHRCHFDPALTNFLLVDNYEQQVSECPPCKQICKVPYKDCEHVCEMPCHDPTPPSPPVIRKKQKKNWKPPPRPTPVAMEAVTCQPCPKTVTRFCLGEHQLRSVVCSTPRQFQCGAKCENPLECGNHLCPFDCHTITHRREWDKDKKGLVIGFHLVKEETGEDKCYKCTAACKKVRSPPCRHPCPLTCHPGTCPRCEVTTKRKCYCGVMPIYIDCYLTHDKDHVARVSSCGNPCRKILPICKHFCTKTCHPGDCPDVRTCQKKVKVRCKCNNHKKEWICSDVIVEKEKQGIDLSKKPKEGGEILLPCDDSCIVYQKERKEAELKQEEEKKKRREEKEKEQGLQRRGGRGTAKAVAVQERTSRKWKTDDNEAKSSVSVYVMLFLGMIVVLCLVALYFFVL